MDSPRQSNTKRRRKVGWAALKKTKSGRKILKKRRRMGRKTA